MQHFQNTFVCDLLSSLGIFFPKLLAVVQSKGKAEHKSEDFPVDWYGLQWKT